MTRLTLNGGAVEAPAEGTLLDWLRKDRGLRAAAKGCGDGSCGSCRVLVDDAATNACTLHLSTLREGARVETFEGLRDEPPVVRVTEAFERERPTRCKLCVAGLGVTAAGLLRARGRGERVAADEAIGQATCMCTGRGSWRRALSAL